MTFGVAEECVQLGLRAGCWSERRGVSPGKIV